MDQEKAEEIAERVVGDMGGAFVMANAYLGDRLGLFEALAGADPLTSEELALRTGLEERYVREWLRAMVAAEYLEVDSDGTLYSMTEEQAHVLAEEESPMFVGGAFHFTTPSMWKVPDVAQAFRNGGGVPYSEMPEEVFEAIERFNAPLYRHKLAQEWIPAVSGLEERLEAGALVADVGCGRGRSTMAMGRAWPASRVIGIDVHEQSIEDARELARGEGLDNVEFVAAPAEQVRELADEGFDLVCTFECIHDMVDPLGALRAVRDSLKEDGIHLWTEPNASHSARENRNVLGRAFHAISPLHCLTVSLAHDGAGLGTVIGEKGVRELAEKAGFSRCEKVEIDDPFTQLHALRR